MADAKRILHIDDDRTMLALVKAILEKGGFQVSQALDAMQGVMMVRQLKPDLVVLDVKMPAGGGASVYERIRALNTTLLTPVLIYSAADSAEIEKTIPAGPLTVSLSKSSPPSALLEAVNALLNRP